ncbi:MAG: hypothetical protein M3077_01325 [Candidatus Dormibacteraeota bacterium]|nr:hypothetical protein [Candidatus Dormibacteraeota bacterium]
MPRSTRQRQAGIAQNFANQLVAIAVGYQIIADGKILSREVPTGILEFDALEGSGTVNGKMADLTMARYLHEWTVDELRRQGLPQSWLANARVTVHFSRNRGDQLGEAADLRGTARIESGYGNASATYSNSQHITVKSSRPSLLRRLGRILRFGP